MALNSGANPEGLSEDVPDLADLSWDGAQVPIHSVDRFVEIESIEDIDP